MKKGFRLLALVLALLVIISCAACKRKNTSDGYWAESDQVETGSDVENSNDATSDTTDSSDSSTETDSSSEKKPSRNPADLMKIRRNVQPKENSQSITASYSLKGKKLKMLAYSEIAEEEKAKVAAFEKKYGCDISLELVNFESYLTTMTTNLAAGTPYDIIRYHSSFFPQGAIASLLQPMESYIYTADIAASKTGKGINWETTYQNATWADHVYYVANWKLTYVNFILYNKLKFDDYGLEDPMTLYKSGKWTWDTILNNAKIVSQTSGGKDYFYDRPMAQKYADSFSYKGWYTIAKDGTITWNGANTDMIKSSESLQKAYSLSKLEGESALIDNFVSGKTFTAVVESVKLQSFLPALKKSAALNKDLSNVGVVPLPTYNGGLCVGYAASKGVNPSAAIIFAIEDSALSDPWESCELPALQANKSVILDIYNKLNVTSNYSFLTSDGRRISEVFYNAQAQIDKGADAMKLYSSYESRIKSVIEYNMSLQ